MRIIGAFAVFLLIQTARCTVHSVSSLQASHSNGRLHEFRPAKLYYRPTAPIAGTVHASNIRPENSRRRLPLIKTKVAPVQSVDPELSIAKRFPLPSINEYIKMHGINALNAAVSEGQSEDFLDRLAHRMIVKFPKEMINAIVVRAAETQATAVARPLLNKGVSTDVLAYLVRRAARLNKRNQIRYLTDELGADPAAQEGIVSIYSEVSGQQELLMSAAAFEGKHEAVREFMANGVDLHYSDDLPLRNTVKRGHVATVLILLENGANPNAQDGAAMKSAAIKGFYRLFRLLEQFGGDVHVGNDSPLRLAAEHGRYHLVRYLLLSRGANVAAKDNAALKLAAFNGHIGVVRLLLANGADPTAENSYALRWAAANGHKGIVRMLIEAGAQVNALNEAQLKLATYFDHWSIVNTLLENGADKSVDGEWPLQIAKSKGHRRVAEILSSSNDSD